MLLSHSDNIPNSNTISSNVNAVSYKLILRNVVLESNLTSTKMDK